MHDTKSRPRWYAVLALGAALVLGMACSSNNNGNGGNTNNTAPATQAASAAATRAAASATTGAPATSTGAAGSATTTGSTTAAGSPAAASGSAAATGGTVSVPDSVVNADKAIAAAAGTGSPIDNVTISKPVEISFWHTQSAARADKLNALIQDFQAKNPNIKVNAQYVGNYDDLFAKMQTAITGNQTPDLAVAYENQDSIYQQANVVVPLDDYVRSQKYGLTKDDYADILQGYRWDNFYAQFGNKMLSFPFTKSIEMMYYNIDALKAAGIDGPPQTWDDFVKDGRAVTKGNVKAWAMGTNVDIFFEGILSRGGKLISDDYKKWQFNSQQGIDTLTVWQQALKEGWGYQIAKQFDDQTDFGNGKAVFNFGSSAGLTFYQTAVNQGAKFNWSATVPPHAPGHDPVTIMYGANVSIFKSTPEKQLAAWLFIKYFTSKEVNPDWSTATGYLPIRTSGLTDPRVLDAIKKLPPYAEAVKGQQYGRPGPPIAATNATRSHIGDMEVALFSDPSKSVKQLLDDTVNQSNQELSR